MGDVGIESTLVLDGLAVSKVRFYSTLDSDVGKRVEITDKFNPLNVFTGTFDESLNLLYDLPAFTSYQVKMYGLDGETVESDQSFMLKGYDYLEKNVGLNKNSFAGIKAIVDQGLEGSLIEIGHEFSEDDNVGDNGGRWIVVAKNVDEDYRHSVYLARKYCLPNLISTKLAEIAQSANHSWFYNPLSVSYFEALPASIKNSITERVTRTGWGPCYPKDGTLNQITDKVWVPTAVERYGNGNIALYGGNNYYFAHGVEKLRTSIFPYYANNANVFQGLKNGQGGTIGCLLMSHATHTSADSSWNSHYATIQVSQNMDNRTSSPYGFNYSNGQQVYSFYVVPHMMIASDPIE